MNSIKFPEMLASTKVNTVSDYYATLQNMKFVLLSNTGSLFGDPEYGVDLEQYMFNPNDTVLEAILRDEIYTKLATFIPQLKFSRDGIVITHEGSHVYINISAINQTNFTTNLYTIQAF